MKVAESIATIADILMKELGLHQVTACNIANTIYHAIPAAPGNSGEADAYREPIQNALYATQQLTTEECEIITDGIVRYLHDAGFSIVLADKAHTETTEKAAEAGLNQKWKARQTLLNHVSFTDTTEGYLIQPVNELDIETAIINAMTDFASSSLPNPSPTETAPETEGEDWNKVIVWARQHQDYDKLMANLKQSFIISKREV